MKNFPILKNSSLKFINSSISLFSSIPPPPYFHQFLHLLIFINSSSPLFLSIPPPPYFHQFLLLLIFINSSSSLFSSIPSPPYFYQFLFLSKFIYSFFSLLWERICFERRIDWQCKYSLRSINNSKNLFLFTDVFSSNLFSSIKSIEI